MEAVKLFLSVNSGSGYGSVYGYGDGDGSGDGSGYGYGDGSGDGSGYGYGYGYGDGSGDGSGSGYGDGSGDGLLKFNTNAIDLIDGVQTIIHSVKNNIAKASIVNSDLTLRPCYVAKVGNHFAHGETIKEAVADAERKHFEDLPIEERIAEFHLIFADKNKAYPNELFYEWHSRLTGSCRLGKDSFMSDKGLLIDGSMTVVEFVKLTENAYGGEVIKQLT
jgi:hypothetical protein